MKTIRYALEALIAFVFYGFFWLLPIDAASWLGGRIARIVGPFLKATRTAKKNLSFALPELSEQEQNALIIAIWDNLGRTVAELPHISGLSKEAFAQRVTVEGSEHLITHLNNNNPAIFFSAHLANWELAPKTAAVYGKPLSIVYRHANNPWTEKLIVFARRGYQLSPIAKGITGARKILITLKAGNPVGMLIDQKMNDGIAVPFFGRDAMTASAIATLARKFKCPVVSAQVIRQRGARFRIIIHPAIYVEHTDDADKDIYHFMVQTNLMMESWIRQNPAQWFWVHNRWPKDV